MTVRLVIRDLSHYSVCSNGGNHHTPLWCLMSCMKLIANRVLAKHRGRFMELLPDSPRCEMTVVDTLDETNSARHSR